MKRYQEAKVAAKEHLLEGKPLTRLEAMIFYGLSSLTAYVSAMRREGWHINSRQVPMATAVARINKYAVLEPPKALPMREILVTEYWLER